MDAATALAQCPLFQSLGRVELDELSLEPNDILFREGEPGNAFYVIRSGQAEVYLDGRGQDDNAILLGPGQVIGEMALLAKERKIALTIEKTLSRRLGESLRRQGSVLDLANRLSAALGEGPRALMARLSRRPSWPRPACTPPWPIPMLSSSPRRGWGRGCAFWFRPRPCRRCWPWWLFRWPSRWG